MLRAGPILPCLLLLSACTSGQPSMVVQTIAIGCPRVIACQLPASKLLNNQDLSAEISALELAWHECAAQIDMIIDCQQKQAGDELISGLVYE